MPDSAPSGAFISTKADAQIVAEVNSIDAWPAVEPRIHQAMSIAAIVAWHSSLRVLAALRHERARMPGARSKTWSHSECATIGLGQNTILRQELTFHNPCESPRSGETKLERKRTKRMVGVRGFEPPTPASRTQYSTRLSYTPNQLFSTLIFVTRNLASTSQARGQQLYAGRDIRAI
jgi:hypothetical protein